MRQVARPRVPLDVGALHRRHLYGRHARRRCLETANPVVVSTGSAGFIVVSTGSAGFQPAPLATYLLASVDALARDGLPAGAGAYGHTPWRSR